MAQSSGAQADTSIASVRGQNKSHDLLTCTIRNPPFSYVHLELISDQPDSQSNLDELQLKSYCAAACRQFLGLTGAAIPMDILKVEGLECWVRVPRQDLGAFLASMTAWKGAVEESGTRNLLRVKQCSDWLGAMVGSSQQSKLWGP